MAWTGPGRPFFFFLCFSLMGIGLVPSSRAEKFFVDDIIDAIPAPQGSLRKALELSEQNGHPDSVAFRIDGGTIELVAPLPDLSEGGLTLGEPRLSGTPGSGSGGIFISGVNGVNHAFRIRSSGNTIANLDFIRFSGDQVILIDGSGADGNAISDCVFGRDNAADGNTSKAVRIKDVTPSSNRLRPNRVGFSTFRNNDVGVAVENSGGTGADFSPVHVHDNWFGTDLTGASGVGNPQAVSVDGAGHVLITRNRISGPGNAIEVVNSDGTTIVDNRLGLNSGDLSSCAGFADAAIEVSDSTGTVIDDNRILCGSVGVRLGPGTDGTRITDNDIGGPSPAGHASHGILLEGAQGTLIRRNRIHDNGGYGVSASGAPAVIACNSITDNVAGALNLPDVLLAPPLLTSATAIDVDGQILDPVGGWVEVFGDAADQAEVFQGALLQTNLTPGFRHRIPVLELTATKAPEGTEIAFDRSVPDNHTSILTGAVGGESTELSTPLSAAQDVLFDVIRGNLDELDFGAAGGITLGPVECLASGLTPDDVISPDVVDSDLPAPGEGFFYVIRRRSLLVNQHGTYDPAICLTGVAGFAGPRSPASGDCP